MAGLLGDIFSAGNVAKRKLTDLLGNPILSAQQMLGNLNDRARVLNEMTTAAAREGVSYGPSSQQLGGLLSEAYNPMGLTVFHGSPAKFQKFDPTKIGSGEGAQSYGYGHYVAESPDVAKSYADKLSSGITPNRHLSVLSSDKDFFDEIQASLKAARASGDYKISSRLENVIQNALNSSEGLAGQKAFWLAQKPRSEAKLKDKNDFLATIDYIESNKALSDSLGKYKSSEKSLYTIDLPDEQIAKMLDYDKPIKDQPEVLKAIRNQIQDEDIAKSFDINVKSGISGANAYQNYVYGKTPAEKAEILRQAGIPGIRYLDQGSRGTGKGTSNFVVFPGNEDLLRILERNNQPLSLLD